MQPQILPKALDDRQCVLEPVALFRTEARQVHHVVDGLRGAALAQVVGKLQRHQHMQRLGQLARHRRRQVAAQQQRVQPLGGAEFGHVVLQREAAHAVHDGKGAELFQVDSRFVVVAQVGQPRPPAVCLGELGVTYQEQQEHIKALWNQLSALGGEVVSHLQVSAQGARGDGGALLYFFETPEGTLLYQDTSGHWSGILQNLRPDVAILAAAGRGNINGEPIQGSLAQFVARQTELLRPGKVVLSHHDNWLPGFSRAIDVTPIRTELARWTPRTELIEMGYIEGYPIFRSR